MAIRNLKDIIKLRQSSRTANYAIYKINVDENLDLPDLSLWTLRFKRPLRAPRKQRFLLHCLQSTTWRMAGFPAVWGPQSRWFPHGDGDIAEISMQAGRARNCPFCILSTSAAHFTNLLYIIFLKSNEQNMCSLSQNCVLSPKSERMSFIILWNNKKTLDNRWA
jgi:hypothetical protein